MKGIGMRVMSAIVMIGGVCLPAIVRIAPVAVAGALLPGCDSGSCELRHCDDLVTGSSLTDNHKDYTHCLSCDADGNCDTWLKDDTDTQFFDCTDGQGTDCTSAVVNAEFNYCGVQ